MENDLFLGERAPTAMRFHPVSLRDQSGDTMKPRLSLFLAPTALLLPNVGHSQGSPIKDPVLRQRADLNRAILDDNTSLVVKLLAQGGYDLAEHNYLARAQSVTMARLLVKNGARPNQASKINGQTPLEYAVSSAVQSDAPRGSATISAILAVGGDVNTPRPDYRPSLMEIVIDGQRHKKRPDILELLLKAGLDPNKRYGVHRPAEQRKFPIAGAAFNGRLDLMQVLLKHGARMSVTTFEGNTLLHVASLENRPGNRDVVAFLLKKGMNREAKNKSGERAIDIAKRKKYGEMIALFSR